ncbi:MAG: hypothetical protein L0Y58_08175 [Verrucomicrobia subdivision 3 bacterium]|nr:hypothetical protein [Limisphaerales bacterium]
MRKRIVIGLIGIGVTAVVAYVISRPREGSIRWHKRRYVEAQNGFFGRTWFTPIEELYCKIAGTRRRLRQIPRNTESYVFYSQMNAHHSALRELGYLVQQEVVISNQSASFVLSNVWASSTRVIPLATARYTDLSFRTVSGTNMIVITAVPKAVHTYEQLIRKADVPGKAN